MTRETIIKAAFKVWGQELYQTMSLKCVAGELGVSKTALYRHFDGKKALLDAMSAYFFDEHTAFIKKDYERALTAKDFKESCLIMIRAISGYYGRNEDAFIFSLFQIFGSRQTGRFSKEMVSRGVDLNTLFQKFYRNISLAPYMIHLVMVSVIFWIGQFHRYDRKSKGLPSDKEIEAFIAGMEERIKRGLGLDAEKIAALHFDQLEEKAIATLPHDTEDNRLLRAVAGAVAEAGPSHASMEMVAHRSGLAKSSLYSHFKNKQDMLDTLFLTEFTRIAVYARENIKTSNVPEEQLCLGLASLAAYLQSRPDILAVMDWLRTQRPKLRPRMISEKQKILPEIYRIITDIDHPAFGKTDREKERIAQWILFLTVKSLVWRLDAGTPDFGGFKADGGDDESFLPGNIRLLYRFIAIGLEGFIL